MPSNMTLTKKALTPKKFGLGMKPVNAAQLYLKISTTLESWSKPNKASSPISARVARLCLDILDCANKGNAECYPEKSIQDISQSDPTEFGIITSDFGEVAGALYYLRYKSSEFKAVKFPEEENEKLIDYILITSDGNDYPVSAKSGEGGKPAFTDLKPQFEFLLSKGMIPKKYEKALKVLELLEKSIFQGPLEAAKYINGPGWQELVKILKNPKLKSGYNGNLPTLENFEDIMKPLTYPDCMEETPAKFRLLWNAINSREKDEKVKRIINDKTLKRSDRKKSWGILFHPLTIEIMNWLNDEKNGGSEILTMAARLKDIDQVYLDRLGSDKNPRGFKFSVVSFSDAKFKFESPSSSVYPTNNRIGFKLIKSSHKTKS
jgi:hypothetical protein